MRIKEADRTANVAWSPASVHPIYLAAGTAAQQLDATFSTTSSLEIYDLNVQEPGLDMSIKGSIETDYRFHKVSWGAFGMNQQETSSGVIVCGCDGGNMFLYNPARIIGSSKKEDALLFHKDKHSGPVSALGFNVFQENLLASGASDSEILIWDLNDPSNPMTPGTKSQPADDVTCIAWNCQVQHILASTFGTRCVVWDLRKNEPIIKVSGSTSRMRCKVVAWHPNVATQMCLASEDDHTPFIQLWDLRFATSPLKTLENHQRGVLSLAWCPQDPDLLLSCGKDCRILCWNPNSNTVGGEVVCEIPTSNQWSFDVAWCPRNPTLISSSSFDGHVSIYSLMGGVQEIRPSAKITEAFMDANYTMQQAPEFTQTTSTYCLNKPPKWFRRPVGASFAFGGKLVIFDNERMHQPVQVNQTANTEAISSLVYISQVETEPELVRKASQLEDVLANGQFTEFCQGKIDSSPSLQEQQVWKFLQAHFDVDPKVKFLSLLGHASPESEPLDRDREWLQEQVSDIRDGPSPSSVFDNIGTDSSATFSIPTSSDTAGVVSKLLLVGNLDAAVKICLHKELLVEALLLSIAGGNDLLLKTQQKYFEMNANDSLTQLIAAIVTRNWSRVVDTCDLNNWKEALAGALVYSSQQEFSSLCETLGRRLEQDSTKGRVHEAMLCYVCSSNVSKLVDCWSNATDDNSSTPALESIVEQVTVLKRVTSDMRSVDTQQSNDTGSMANVLYRYSSILASQGKLSTALLHLEPSEEKSIALLQNRLSRALNLQSAGAAVQRPSFDVGQQQSRPVQLQQRQGHSLAQPNLHSSTVRPQRNESLPHMSKYPTAMPQATSPPIQPYSRGPLNPRYPQGYSDNQSTSYGQTMPNSFGNAEMSSHLMQSPIPAYGVSPANNASLVYNPSPYEPPSYRSNTPAPYQPLQPENYGLIQNNSNDSKPGWNDPPLIAKSTHKLHQEFEQPAPITHPLYGTTPEATSSGTYNQGSFEPSVYPQQYQQQHLPTDIANCGLPGVAPLQPAQSLPTVVPTRPQMMVKPKGPIPTEHQILYDLFEDLKCKCLVASTSMPMKRKLEEVNRKLEVLYDKLRDNELTSNTTLGLHQVIQAIQQGDYQTALLIHTQMVSTGAFSEIGGFMPGLKVLLQTAQHLAIYIQ